MIYQIIPDEVGLGTYLMPAYQHMYYFYKIMDNTYPICHRGAGQWQLVCYRNYEDAIFIPTSVD